VKVTGAAQALPAADSNSRHAMRLGRFMVIQLLDWSDAARRTLIVTLRG
jgi:hypothetical protein